MSGSAASTNETALCDLNPPIGREPLWSKVAIRFLFSDKQLQ